MRRSHPRATLAAMRRREWLLRMLLLGAAGCRAADRAVSRASTVTIAYWGGDHALSPPEDESAKFLVFLPLVIADVHGNLEGRLGERWEHSADYRDWTYHLRPGVRWHDGTPVTAHDVEFSVKLFADHRNGFGPGTSVTAIDDRTVSIRSSTGNPGVGELQPVERNGTLMDELKRGRFEAAVTYFVPTASWMAELFGPGTPTGYENPALVDLLRRWTNATDPDTLDRIQDEVAEIFRQDLPLTFLFPGINMSYAHRRVRGLESAWAEQFAKPEDLRIEE